MNTTRSLPPKFSRPGRRNILRDQLKRSLSYLLLLCAAGEVHAGSMQFSFRDEQQQPVSDVVVVLQPQQPQTTLARSPQTAIIDQRDQQFVPHVLAVRTNTLVSFPNSDDIRHHVYSFSPAKRFELRLYHSFTADPVLFDKPGQVVLGCNIHDSMLGYIYVVDSDYFGVADAQGQVAIDKIPSGEYRLQIHHPRLSQSQLPEAETVTINGDNQYKKTFILPKLQPDPRSMSGGGELESLFK